METAVQDSNDLIAAAYNIFEQGGSTFPLPTLKRDVTIKAARMGQIAAVMQLFRKIADSVDNTHIMSVVNAVSKVQTQHMQDGKNPRELDIAAIAATQLESEGAQTISIISIFMEVAALHLPTMAAIFSDITVEEFENLEIDEGALVSFAIFAHNYDFFTQRLLPILTAFMMSLASRARSQSASEGDVPALPLPKQK